jgi:hypothetical protein
MQGPPCVHKARGVHHHLKVWVALKVAAMVATRNEVRRGGAVVPVPTKKETSTSCMRFFYHRKKHSREESRLMTDIHRGVHREDTVVVPCICEGEPQATALWILRRIAPHHEIVCHTTREGGFEKNGHTTDMGRRCGSEIACARPPTRGMSTKATA